MRGKKKQENVKLLLPLHDCKKSVIISSFQHKHFYIMTIYTNYKETHVTGFP